MEAATAATDLDDFGPGEFRAGAVLLMEDAARSGANVAGMARLEARVSRQLENRLRVQADRRRHAQIAAQKIVAPILIMGLPRSGTTFLHSLLAQDPRLRSPLQWEVSRPSPPPHEDSLASDPRILQCRAEMAGDGETQRLHMQDAELPVECGPVAAAEFMNTGNFAFWNAPRYLARVMGGEGRAPVVASYAWHRRMLQQLQAFTRPARWVLKSPQHIANLGELLDTYPDATLVFTHRDPVETIPSLASLVSHFRAACYDRPDEAAIGADVFTLWNTAMQRCMAFRAANPAIASQCIDVSYIDLLARPVEAATQILAVAGLAPDPARARLEAFAAANRQDRYQARHGRHDYSAERFGLTVETIADRFASYRLAHVGAMA